jgi:hypothetical protein
MQSTQAKNTQYNRKIAFWHFANRQPRRDQSKSRCNQNAIITRSIARRRCIASKFARRCSYSDRKDKFTARLNFARGKNASQNENARGCNAAFSRCIAACIAPRCGKSLMFNDIFPCKINNLAPSVEKAHPSVEKAQGKINTPSEEKAHPSVEKAQ